MKTYRIVIEEKLVYEVEVEAHSEDEAIDLAYNSEKFTSNIPDSNDSIIAEIEVVE